MDIRIGEETYKAEFNGFTPIAYSQAFYELSESGRKQPSDIADAVSQIATSLTTYEVPAIVPLLKILYACIKTADPKFPKSFNDFASSLPVGAYDLRCEEGWATDVMRIVEENFFPETGDGVDSAQAEEADAEPSK